MNPATAVIADDEANLRIHLREMLAQVWPELHIVGEAVNGLDAVSLIDELRPDIVFLDIKMPGLSGIDAARSMQGRAQVVFVTAFDEFAVQAFERQAVDYLLKPVSAERLRNTAQRLKTALAARATQIAPDLNALAKLLSQANIAQTPTQALLRFIRASRGDTVYQVAVEDVLFFQSDNKVTVVQTAQSEYVIRTSLQELLSQLDPQVFWQIHRGTAVNANKVLSAQRDFAGNMQLMLNGHPKAIAVARGYQGLFRQM